MPISDAMVEGAPVLDQTSFDEGSGWSLDTSKPLDGGIIGGSDTYHNRDGDLHAGYYDSLYQTYAFHPPDFNGENNGNNNQVNGERAVSFSPGGTLPHLTAFSTRPNPSDPNAPDELVITGRRPTPAEAPHCHYHGYYIGEDGNSARASSRTSIWSSKASAMQSAVISSCVGLIPPLVNTVS